MKAPRFAKSLVFKISFTIFLMESMVFSLLGCYYISRYSQKIDAQIEATGENPWHAHVPTAAALRLRPRSVRDPGADRRAGRNGRWLCGSNGEVFYASDPALEGRFFDVGNTLPPESRSDFDPLMTESRVHHTTLAGRPCVVVITPLRSRDQLIGYLYLEADTTHSTGDKRATAMGFALSSAVCIPPDDADRSVPGAGAHATAHSRDDSLPASAACSRAI